MVLEPDEMEPCARIAPRHSEPDYCGSVRFRVHTDAQFVIRKTKNAQ